MSTHPDAAVFAARRARYLERLGDDAALLVAPHHAHRNADAEYRYRQSSDLVYLTGWEDPEAVALFRPKSETPYVLFVQPKDPEREVWTGIRPGVVGAKELHGADAAFPIHELASRLPTLLFGYGTLHYRPGDDAGMDRTVFGAIRGMAKPAARNGGEIPWRYAEPSRLVGELRLRKGPEELERLRMAARISAEAHVLAMGEGRPGVGEYELDALIDGHFRKRGGNAPGYTTIVGGGANAQQVAAAFRIITADPNVKGILVNIFGGIMKCDTIANGVIAAVKEVGLQVPLVVRLAGTNVELGRKILAESGLDVVGVGDLDEAAEAIVSAVKARGT